MSVDKLVFSTLVIVLLFGCTRSKFESQDQIWEYINDPAHGLKQELQANNYTISIYYKPKPLLILQELRINDSIQEISKLQSKYKNYDYFIIQYKKKDGIPMLDEERSKYSDLLRSIAYRFQDYAFIKKGDYSKIPPVDFSYFPTFNLRDQLELLLVFRNDHYQGLEKVGIHIRDVGFGIGDQIFEFDIDKIKNIPEYNWKIDQLKN